MTTRSCGACYKPFRGAATRAVLIGATSRRALVCPKCAARGLLVVIEEGAVIERVRELLDAERRAVEASKRAERRRRAAPPADADAYDPLGCRECEGRGVAPEDGSTCEACGGSGRI